MTGLQQTYLFSVLGHTHTRSGCKMTGTYFKNKQAKENKRETNKKNKSVSIL